MASMFINIFETAKLTFSKVTVKHFNNSAGLSKKKLFYCIS